MPLRAILNRTRSVAPVQRAEYNRRVGVLLQREAATGQFLRWRHAAVRMLVFRAWEAAAVLAAVRARTHPHMRAFRAWARLALGRYLFWRRTASAP
jgi:hypothetical protein